MRSRVFSRLVAPALGGAAAALVVIAIAVAVLLPQLCGGQSCVTVPARDDSEELRTALEVAAKEPLTATVTEPVPVPNTDQTAADLLTETFGALPAKSSTPATATALQAPESDPSGPARRVVQSVRIGSDGKPAAPQADDALVPLPTPAPLVAPTSTDTTATDLAGVDPSQDIEPLLDGPAIDAPVPEVRPPGLGDTDPPPSSAPSSGGVKRTVTGGGVNVREGPSSGQQVLYSLAPGDTVRVVGQERRWLNIVDEEGRTGWVDQDYVR